MYRGYCILASLYILYSLWGHRRVEGIGRLERLERLGGVGGLERKSDF